MMKGKIITCTKCGRIKTTFLIPLDKRVYRYGFHCGEDCNENGKGIIISHELVDAHRGSIPDYVHNYMTMHLGEFKKKKGPNLKRVNP